MMPSCCGLLIYLSIYLLLTNYSHSDFEQPNDSTELEEYEEYCRRELPRIVRATVEEIVNRETQPMEDRLINQIESIIRNAQNQVYASYRSACTSNTTNRSMCESISKSAPEGSVSVQLGKPVDSQDEQLRPFKPLNPPSGSHLEFSWQENDTSTSSEPRLFLTSGYGSNSSVAISLPRTSTELTELEGFSHQAVSSEISQSGGSASGTRPLQDINSGEASSSHNDLDWSVVAELEDNRDSTFDHDDAVWVGFEEEGYRGFDLDTFMGVNPLKVADKLP